MIIVGNWKMYGSYDLLLQWDKNKGAIPDDVYLSSNVVICPPYLLIHGLGKILSQTPILIGAQDCSAISNSQGSYTGEISADMIKKSGAHYVIIGHSERIRYCKEDLDCISKKVLNALHFSLVPIVCFGEKEKDGDISYKVSNFLSFIESFRDISSKNNVRFDNIIFAYEPEWSIGQKEPANPSEIKRIFQQVKSLVPKIKLLYGGSVNWTNCTDFCGHFIDGLLVGRASVDITDFQKILSRVSNV